MKSKKYIFLIVVVVLLVLLGGVLGFRLYYGNRSTGSSWGDIYYKYIKDSRDNNEDYQIRDGSTVEFIQVSSDMDPVMVVSYDEDKEKGTNLYYIQDGTVDNVIVLPGSEIEFLYNIEKEEYAWYSHTENDDLDSYVRVFDVIHSEDASSGDNYSFSDSVNSFNGNPVMSSDSFNSVFVAVDVTVEGVSYDKDFSDSKLRDAIASSVEHYQPNDKYVTDEVEAFVDEKVLEIGSSSSLDDGVLSSLVVGDYHLEFGTYKNGVEEFVLREDGSCQYGTIYDEVVACTYTTINSSSRDIPSGEISNYYEVVLSLTDEDVRFVVCGDNCLKDQMGTLEYQG